MLINQKTGTSCGLLVVRIDFSIIDFLPPISDYIDFCFFDRLWLKLIEEFRKIDITIPKEKVFTFSLSLKERSSHPQFTFFPFSSLKKIFFVWLGRRVILPWNRSRKSTHTYISLIFVDLCHWIRFLQS